MSSSQTIDSDELAAITGVYAVSVDGKTQASFTLVSNSKPDQNFYITDLILELVSVSGLSSTPTISLGKVGPNFTDVFNTQAITSLQTAGKALFPSLGSGQRAVLAPGDSLVFSISTGATATDYTLKPIVRGFYA